MTTPLEILAPYAEQFHRPQPKPLSPRLSDLSGKTIGLIFNMFEATRLVHHEIEKSLLDRGCQIVRTSKKYWKPLSSEGFRELVEGVDAVVSGLSNTPPSSFWSTYESVEFEKLGKPTVTFATQPYEQLIAETADAEGMPDLKRVILPFPLEGVAADRVTAVGRLAVDHVIAALTLANAETVVRIGWDG